MSRRMSREQYAALKKLMELHFVVIELELFLDTHPNDVEALRLYNDTAMRYQNMLCEYQRKYGMIMAHSVDYTDPRMWDWVEGPWPWEIEYA